jgi:hypothetical protein
MMNGRGDRCVGSAASEAFAEVAHWAEASCVVTNVGASRPQNLIIRSEALTEAKPIVKERLNMRFQPWHDLAENIMLFLEGVPVLRQKAFPNMH